ncbi:FAD:protein FMN transferase [Croceitalea vernalis]|uniref:FAD:protein FMN transferase n=1 Tax=Croceitalea vernalis TaxID=3075599 RepID=A0ABU3BGI1_9FLAO|nr:FAD:protein FMN transferase [Croceitalea sp. P007]MDT0621243.1 FAD:protein FMN transferase [Croceitalea sp. P007]
MKKVILVFIILVIAGCQEKSSWIKNQNIGNALGTTYSIIYIAHKEVDFQKEIDSVFQVINQSMSTYIPDSDISKINDGDTTVVVDTMFKEVFELSTQVYETSDGYFDPSVGVLANAWGFGPGKQIQLDSIKIDSLLNFVGWNKVKLSPNGTIKKLHPEIRFDFNAIAKGYAIDRLGVLLNNREIENYLIEVGGEVLTQGHNTVTAKDWTVGIDNPNDVLQRGTSAIITLRNKALASSGNYRKFRIDPETGEKYVHTIDPKTGYTKNSRVLASSVLASNCAIADAYATTFMTLDLEESKSLLENNQELDAYIIYLDEYDRPQQFMTDGFKTLVKN